MNRKKKIFLLIIAVLLIVFVAPVIVTAFSQNSTVNFALRTMLVLGAIYLVLEISDNIHRNKE